MHSNIHQYIHPLQSNHLLYYMTLTDTIITKLIAYRKQNGYSRIIHPEEIIEHKHEWVFIPPNARECTTCSMYLVG